MNSLEFSRLTDASILSEFYCGVDTMDDFLHGEFKDYLYLGICKAYAVKMDNQLVAIYTTDSFNVFISDKLKENMREGIKPIPGIALDPSHPYWTMPLIDSIEITYLAVAKEYQHKHIGSVIIEKIVQDLKKAHCTSPLLTVRAYNTIQYTTVPFYEKCGFYPAEAESSTKQTLCMYRIIA